MNQVSRVSLQKKLGWTELLMIPGVYEVNWGFSWRALPFHWGFSWRAWPFHLDQDGETSKWDRCSTSFRKVSPLYAVHAITANSRWCLSDSEWLGAETVDPAMIFWDGIIFTQAMKGVHTIHSWSVKHESSKFTILWWNLEFVIISW
jgi:hypothetical protein